jgi:hypothetical protein
MSSAVLRRTARERPSCSSIRTTKPTTGCIGPKRRRTRNPLPSNCARSDAILDGLGVDAIDILKIDVQGSEFSAITGAAKTIRNSPGMMLLSEFWPDGIRRAAGCAPERYLELLRDLGLDLFELRRRQLAPLSSERTSRLSGRHYLNLIGIAKT